MTTNKFDTTLTMPSDREIMITRLFNAPRELVFKVWTQPEHIKHWYGPEDYTLVACEVDLRVGGKWHFMLRDKDGDDFGFGGEYQEVVPSEKLVYTDGFDGAPGHEALVTLLFEEQDGKTLLKSTSYYKTFEDREFHIQSGMEAGMRATMERLAEHLQTLK